MNNQFSNDKTDEWEARQDATRQEKRIAMPKQPSPWMNETAQEIGERSRDIGCCLSVETMAEIIAQHAPPDGHAALVRALRIAAEESFMMKNGLMKLRDSTELGPQREEWVRDKTKQWLAEAALRAEGSQ